MPRGAGDLTICISSCGRAQRLTSFSWLCMAFDEQFIGDEALARRYSVDAKTISDSIVLVSGMLLGVASALITRV